VYAIAAFALPDCISYSVVSQIDVRLPCCRLQPCSRTGTAMAVCNADIFRDITKQPDPMTKVPNQLSVTSGYRRPRTNVQPYPKASFAVRSVLMFLKLIGYGYTCPRGKVVYDCAQTGIVKGLKHLCNVFVCNAFTEHAPNLLHTLTSKQTMLKIITYTM